MLRTTTKCLGLILLACAVLAIPSAGQVSLGVSIHIGPPPLPVYTQPVCPAAGYIWTPGYWAYGPEGYYWVPGTWVQPPEVGVLWTPGYWGSSGGGYLWHAGYWGPRVGFYGGINYGFGYNGVGFVGGVWRGREFAYNTAVMNVNTRVIHTTYIDRTVIRNTTINRVSYNGGHGGISAQPRPEEREAERERHIAASSMQIRHEQAARGNRNLLMSVNHGRPAMAATPRPGDFHGARAAGSNAGRPVPRPTHATEYRPVNNVSNNRAVQNNVPRPRGNAGDAAHNRSNNNGRQGDHQNMAREHQGNGHSEQRKDH